MSEPIAEFVQPLISCSIPARIGFLGNPSDGYFGACISLPVWNWQATVTLSPPEMDVSTPELPEDPGLRRIMQATLTVFEKRFDLSPRPFCAKVSTTIPRQVGLSGSSAIETAFMLCLMAYHDVPIDSISARELAELVQKVETEELGMVAGLQDRLPQAYGEMLHMDFNEKLMTTRGFGEYTKLETKSLPKLWVAHAQSGEDSGKTHENIAQRWEEKDPQMIEIIGHLAGGANAGKKLLTQKEQPDKDRVGEIANIKELASLIDTNFDLRRELFGDSALGETLNAVKLARSLGSCAKQCGSCGSIFGIIPDADFANVAATAFSEIGWTFHAEIEVEH